MPLHAGRGDDPVRDADRVFRLPSNPAIVRKDAEDRRLTERRWTEAGRLPLPAPKSCARILIELKVHRR
ncbi:MAG: hypothetical protein IPM29_32905 [Planctomycetes bacterium]|nr:hypothetical protein [Planctomycetota bacterium]